MNRFPIANFLETRSVSVSDSIFNTTLGRHKLYVPLDSGSSALPPIRGIPLQKSHTPKLPPLRKQFNSDLLQSWNNITTLPFIKEQVTLPGCDSLLGPFPGPQVLPLTLPRANTRDVASPPTEQDLQKRSLQKRPPTILFSSSRPLFGVDYEVSDVSSSGSDTLDLAFTYAIGDYPSSYINPTLIHPPLIRFEDSSQEPDCDHPSDALYCSKSDKITEGHKAEPQASRTCCGSDPYDISEMFLPEIFDNSDMLTSVTCVDPLTVTRQLGPVGPMFYRPANQRWVRASLKFYRSIDQRLRLPIPDEEFDSIAASITARFSRGALNWVERAIASFFPLTINQEIEWQDYCVLYQVADILSSRELDLANALRHMLHEYAIVDYRDDEDRFEYNMDFIVDFIVSRTF